MPVEVDRVEQADGDGVVRRRPERRGDRIDREREVLPGGGEHRVRDALPGDSLDAGVRELDRRLRVVVDRSVAATWPPSSARMTSGCAAR